MTLTVAQTDDIAACQALRRIVFTEEQGVSVADEVDGLDGVALHLIAHDDGIPVGAARILIKSDIAKIGRVCVLKNCRSRGIGTELVVATLKVTRQLHGVTRAQLGAQLHALAFYEKLGFTAFGPIYDDAGIDHRDMEFVL